MKPLIVLIFTFIIAVFTIKTMYGTYEFSASARIGMSVMLLFTALGHFIYTSGMAMMIPDFIPLKKEFIYITAIIEILAAIGIHIPQLRPIIGWLLILFFILLLPANIKTSIDQLDYQKGTYDGNGLVYLWFRIPLQVVFISWVYISSIYYK
ncbi:DoxX family protein [Aquimarina muelleri]|uniref:DoxX family protein n=1 Tax=Aquimarina muelleri TaxID=279356 RepID=UPI003F684C85